MKRRIDRIANARIAPTAKPSRQLIEARMFTSNS